MSTSSQENQANQLLGGERIASRCVCCGSRNLHKSPAIIMPFVAHRAFGWKPIAITEEWGLKTIKTGMAYSICNSVQCAHCRFLFLDIRFTQSELNALYDGYREEQYAELRERYEPGYKERNERLNAGYTHIPEIEHFLSPLLKFPISILDWGGDTGKNTPFKDRNKLLHVYDISNKAVISGAQKVDYGTTRRTDYDLIVCSQVLEHVPYPAELILDMRQAMGKSTILYIEVPCESLILGEKEGLHKQKKHWHEHINFFTEKSLRELLTRCGLSISHLERRRLTPDPASSWLFQIACQRN